MRLPFNACIVDGKVRMDRRLKRLDDVPTLVAARRLPVVDEVAAKRLEPICSDVASVKDVVAVGAEIVLVATELVVVAAPAICDTDAGRLVTIDCTVTEVVVVDTAVKAETRLLVELAYSMYPTTVTVDSGRLCVVRAETDGVEIVVIEDLTTGASDVAALLAVIAVIA